MRKKNYEAKNHRCQNSGRRAQKQPQLTEARVFSREMLVSVDSDREFKSILIGFKEELHPVATVKELLVEDLTFTALQKKRLVVGDRAAIKQSIAFMQRDEQLK